MYNFQNFVRHLLQTTLTTLIAIVIGELWYRHTITTIYKLPVESQLGQIIKISNIYGLIVPFIEALLMFFLFIQKKFVSKIDYITSIFFILFSYTMFLCARSGSIFFTSTISGKGVSDTIQLDDLNSYINLIVFILLYAFLRWSVLILMVHELKVLPKAKH